MSCVLRAIGVGFDVDGFLSDSDFAAAAVFRRGESRLPGAPDSPRLSASGFNLAIGQAGFEDLEGQIREAARFLNEQEDELRRLASYPGVEEVCLDFGVPRREVAAQNDVFPADLLWRLGALDIDLVLTHYAVAEKEP
jgi:hypothetical protein